MGKKSSVDESETKSDPPPIVQDHDNWYEKHFFMFLLYTWRRVIVEFKLLGNWTYMNFEKRLKDTTYIFTLKVLNKCADNFVGGVNY